MCKEKLLRHLSNKTFLRIPIRKSKEKKCIIDIRSIVTMPQGAFKSTKRTRNLLTLLRTKDTLRILPTISIMHRQHRCLTIIPLCLTFHPFRCKGTIRPTTRILSLSIRLTKRFRRRKPRPPRRQRKVIDLWLSPRANQYYYQISNKFTYHYISSTSMSSISSLWCYIFGSSFSSYFYSQSIEESLISASSGSDILSKMLF